MRKKRKRMDEERAAAAASMDPDAANGVRTSLAPEAKWKRIMGKNGARRVGNPSHGQGRAGGDNVGMAALSHNQLVSTLLGSTSAGIELNRVPKSSAQLSKEYNSY